MSEVEKRKEIRNGGNACGCKRERERERELEFRKNRREKVQLSCACLSKKDGLRKLGCLFCACDSS